MEELTPILILDGGLGTTLETKHGVSFSQDTPLWSSHLLLDDQNTLLDCQSSFAKAGADILMTATYQVSIDGFGATKTSKFPQGVPPSEIGKFLQDAVLIAEKAGTSAAGAGNGRGPVSIALSMGPYGATQRPNSTEYSGQYDGAHCKIEQLAEWHAERMVLYAKIDGLLDRVEYIAFETVPRVDEIRAMRQVMAEHVRLGGSNKWWISTVWPGDDEEPRLPDGSSAEEVVYAMLRPKLVGGVPWGIGINCTKVEKLPGLVNKFRDAVQGLVDLGMVEGWPALVLCPDGTKDGEVYNTTTKRWEIPEGMEKGKDQKPWETQVAEVVQQAKKTGKWVSILVGGCCRTTDTDIERLRQAVLGPENAVDN
ncbi:Homocysteine S-methyltransferase [Podospora australis]|uniref:Homocysteine S-methyltransferase n=1 Tax=Podospora australis TaxID=1536484 RepID=A0AAN6WJS4_9PEZI|nr:Homocysteine S-methyltransferase [Podospora australis]